MPNPPPVDLPTNLGFTSQQTAALNDRIDQIREYFKNYVPNPFDEDVDAGNFKLFNLADPTADQDAVNLRTLKRFGGGTTTQQQVSSSGLDYYTIVFSKDGYVSDGEITTDFVIGSNRTGTIVEAWLRAKSAPVLNQISVNFTVNGSTVLNSDLTLAIGASGPVFSTGIAYSSLLLHGDLVTPKITTSGSAGLISMGLVVKRS